ncbi:TetR family transcriptional regulator [Azospirillum sp.]|uniref:TetR family transcriptional regulator n=1 Tax=Azospirillum sp. TaxID=34012 RepID=UPI003D73AB7F
MDAATATESPRKPRKAGTPRDPEGTRARILAAARDEFARHGLGGARVDRIAEAAGTNKRMLYYHVGNKQELYLAVLEAAYADIRTAERALSLETLAPPDAIARLIAFTWQYFIEHPEFLALLNTENIHRAEHLRRSQNVASMHSPFVRLIADVLARGEADGVFRTGVDPVQLYISIAALAYFYLSNVHTLSAIFGRDLLAESAKSERLAHMTELVLASLRR